MTSLPHFCRCFCCTFTASISALLMLLLLLRMHYCSVFCTSAATFASFFRSFATFLRDIQLHLCCCFSCTLASIFALFLSMILMRFSFHSCILVAAFVIGELSLNQERHYGRVVMTTYMGAVVGPDSSATSWQQKQSDSSSPALV